MADKSISSIKYIQSGSTELTEVGLKDTVARQQISDLQNEIDTKIIASTVDIAVGSELATGTLYCVYAE